MKKYWLLGLVVVALVAVAFLFTGKKPTPQNSAEQAPQPATETNSAETSKPAETNTSVEINTSTSTTQPLDLSKYNTPIMIIDQKKAYTAKVKTTAGEIEIALNAAATPITVNNFVFLAKKNFYDNTIFHRVIKGFMIQGGDPKGNGTGGPGYQFDDEPFNAEYTRGTIAMANSGPNTNGSQFFIMHDDYPLPPNYVIFGKVIKGLDVVDKIATAPVTASESGEDSKPVNPVKIVSVEIIEK